MPKVFIIILHYKNWNDTNECLKSLEDLDYDSFEKIVVDNDKENRGFAGGNNIGIKQALEGDAKYILLLNNDTVVDKNFLKKLIKVGESDEKIGILGPTIYEYKTNKIHFAGGKINRLYTKGKHITVISEQRTMNSDYITGCCLLIKRKVIEKIGLMPEDYFLYFEDADWCLKARKAGFKCVAVSTAKIWHKVSQGAVEVSFSYIYYHFRNGLLLSKRNAPIFIKILAYLNSFWVFAKQIIKLAIPSRQKWAKAIMLGIRDFHRGKFGKISTTAPPTRP
jgi:GT2 family glycosyltransferase